MIRRLAGWGLCVLALAALAMPWRASAHAPSADLGRVARVIAPDGAETVTGYDGAIVTVTDPAGAKRQTTPDALGRIVEVVEAPGAQGYLTNYAYDARGNLQQVTQGSQTRTFAYDTLGRLVSATNPESGKTCYGEMVSGLCQARYDGNGNLLKKTDARGVVTTMGYDALNRATSKSFSNGDSAVSFVYDANQAIAGVSTENRPVGRLVSVSNAAGATVYRWDGMGRPLASRQTPAGSVPYVFEYAHKPAGLASMTYPSGRRVEWSYDEAGRTHSVTGLKAGNATNYLTGATYAPHGGLAEFQFGGVKIEQICYNNRMQPVGIRVGANPTAGCAGAGGDLLHLTLGYGAANNNGNVRTQVIQAPGGNFAQTYNYDPLNRLCSVREVQATTPWGPHACGDMQGLFGGEAWRQTFGFDQFGNQWVAQHLGASMPYSGLRPTQQSNINAANNRLAEVANQIAFDAAGYQTRHGGWTLVHDAEGRIKTATPSSGSAASYEYDGEGRRVKKTVGSTSTWFVYNAMGELAAEYLASAPSGAAATHYVTTDHLGSTRLVTDAAGNVVSRHDYLPFGEEIPAGMGGRTAAMGYVANAALTQRFTGKERDAETGLDFFLARYMSSVQGRFTSPDKPFADQTPFDPQSWNLYSYTRNNPLKYIDRTGEAIETLWDALNIGIGVTSFVDNVQTGNYGAAALDALGVVVDSAAAVVPLIPGGAGAGIKAVRAADRVADAADLATTSNRIDNAVDASGTTASLVTDTAQGKIAQGAANPKVKEALARGQEAHKQANYGPGFKKEVTLPSGKRMDAYNKTDKRVVELKPANPRAVNRGEKQVKQYCKECDDVYGPGHTGEVRTYR
ncbi:MAG: hypothetical protein IT169_01050 [Bryobacterales bacterium]|nr:hypothetical protein [Bryobacterales bacterium]